MQKVEIADAIATQWVQSSPVAYQVRPDRYGYAQAEDMLSDTELTEALAKLGLFVSVGLCELAQVSSFGYVIATGDGEDCQRSYFSDAVERAQFLSDLGEPASVWRAGDYYCQEFAPAQRWASRATLRPLACFE